MLPADTFPQEQFWAYLAYAEAQYAIVTGATSDVLDQLERVKANYRRWIGGGAVAGPLLAAATADTLLALDRANHARQVTTGEHAGHPFLRVSQARLALLTGQTDAALRLASDNDWQRTATTRDRLDMLLIQAVALHWSNEREAAGDALERAVDTARLTGALRPFRSVPYAELQAIAADRPAAADLLDQPAVKTQRDLYPSRAEFIDLTTREQQILERLVADLTVQQIATSLRISYNTVKVQQRSLYRKLDVSSKADAVARGRQHGLIPSP